MIVAARHSMIYRPYDAEVEWLESDGGQYVDTGCVASSSLGLELELEYRGSFSNTVNGPGVLKRPSPYVRHHLNTQDNYGWRYLLGAGNVPFAESDRSGRVSVAVDAVNRTVTVNGVTESWASVAAFDTGLAYWLPARHDSNGTATPFVGRVYSARFFVDGIVVRDLIPVRFTNELGQSEGAMFDRRGTGGMDPDGSARNDGIYRNQGTGAFVVGSDVTQ